MKCASVHGTDDPPPKPPGTRGVRGRKVALWEAPQELEQGQAASSREGLLACHQP